MLTAVTLWFMRYKATELRHKSKNTQSLDEPDRMTFKRWANACLHDQNKNNDKGIHPSYPHHE